MQERLDRVSQYSPGNCTPEFLEKILVGRHELLGRMETKVVRAIESGAGHHWLLVGPRGVGKTHLLAMLRNRIDADDALRNRVIIAYMCEEERGVATYLDWVVAILNAFIRWQTGPDDLESRVAELAQLPLGQAERKAEGLLIDSVSGQVVFLVVENLGEIFSEKRGFGREGQRRFRDLIQQHGNWLVVASTQSLFEDIRTQDGPFYGFFQIEHLPMLTADEAVQLLEVLARHDGRTDLVEYILSPPGRGRVRAIHEITGGNPRLLVIFYQFIDGDSIEQLAVPFQEMVDNLTSFYQEQLNRLSALQEKIVHFLCEKRSAAPVKDIARNCFCQPQSVAVQLGRLEDEAFVQKTIVGRESHYELREPLMRICFEVKRNQGFPIRLFVDFLGRFYTVTELRRQYQVANLVNALQKANDALLESHSTALELAYITAAVTSYYPDQLNDFVSYPTETNFGLEVVENELTDLMKCNDFRGAARLAEAASGYHLANSNVLLAQVRAHQNLGNIEKASRCLAQLLLLEPENSAAWSEKAKIERAHRDYDCERETLLKCLELDCDGIEIRLRIIVNCFERKDIDGALKETEYLVRIAENLEPAWVILGLLRLSRKDFDGSVTALENAARIRPNCAKNIAYLARALDNIGETGKALEKLRKAVALEPTDDEILSEYITLLIKSGQHSLASDEAEKWTSISPGSGAAWFAVGKLQGIYGKLEQARDSFIKSLEIHPANRLAWHLLGTIEGQLGNDHAALKCFDRANLLDSSDSANWLCHGVSLIALSRPEDALASLYQATKLNRENLTAWRLIATLEGELQHLGAVEQAALIILGLNSASSRELCEIGEILFSLRSPSLASQMFRLAIKTDPADRGAKIFLAAHRYSEGDPNGATKLLRKAQSSPHFVEQLNSLRSPISRLIDSTLRDAPLEVVEESLMSQIECFGEKNALDFYCDVLESALVSLVRDHETLPLARLRSIGTWLSSRLREFSKLTVACRMFESAVGFLESRDKRILLDMPLEERRVLAEILDSEVGPFFLH